MSSDDSFERAEAHRLRVLLYLIPVAGLGPALWCLYRQRPHRWERQASRTAIALALVWVGSGLAAIAGDSTGLMSHLSFLLVLSLLTSGYFLTSVWLMVQFSRGKRLWLPGISDIGDRLP